jgi:hypothetical protein
VKNKHQDLVTRKLKFFSGYIIILWRRSVEGYHLTACGAESAGHLYKNKKVCEKLADLRRKLHDSLSSFTILVTKKH